MKKFIYLIIFAILFCNFFITTKLAHALITTTSATINNASSVIVLPGASLNIVLTVNMTSLSNLWHGTSYAIDTTPLGNAFCVDTPNHNGIGTYIENFTVLAPVIPGIYDAYFQAKSTNACATPAGSLLTLLNVITVSKIDQIITFSTPPDKIYGDMDFDLNATSSSNLPVSFVSQTTSVCTTSDINSATVHIVAEGTCIIRASQAGNEIYGDAPNIDQSFNIAKRVLTITLGNTTQIYDGNIKSVTTSTTPSNLNIDVTYEGSSIIPINAGIYTVVATINDPNYTGSTTGTLTINKATATIVVTPYSVTYDGSSHMATGTATGVNNTDLSTSLNLVNTTHTSAGIYAIDAWTFTGGVNYNDANGTVSNLIAKKNITVTADAKSKNFGTTDPILTYSITTGSLVAGDNFSGALVRNIGETSGTYPIIQGTLALNNNYTFNFTGANLIIIDQAPSGPQGSGGLVVSMPILLDTGRPNAEVESFTVNSQSTSGNVAVSGAAGAGNIGTGTSQVLGAEIFKFTKDLKLGSKGNEVKELEKRLTTKGYYKGLIDGRFGMNVFKAVKAYQKANPPLKVDGRVGVRVRAVLNK